MSSKPVPGIRVIANFALTWDGKISTRNKTRTDFPSAADKRRLLEIRSGADALLVGRTTLETENMAMGLPAADLRKERVVRGQPEYPLRVVISNSGRIDPALKLFRLRFSPIHIFSTEAMPIALRKRLADRAVLHLENAREVSLPAMLRLLRTEYKVRQLVCEGGASLLRSLLMKNLVDEICLTFCPLVFGGQKAPTLTGLPAGFLPKSIQCRMTEMETRGGECFTRYKVMR